MTLEVRAADWPCLGRSAARPPLAASVVFELWPSQNAAL